MYQERIEIANFPLLRVVWGKREMIMIGIIKQFIKSAEQSCHTQVHAAVPEINSRIDQYRL